MVYYGDFGELLWREFKKACEVVEAVPVIRVGSFLVDPHKVLAIPVGLIGYP